MSSKVRSSLVLVAFVAGIGVTYAAPGQALTPQPHVFSQHTMRDSSDTGSNCLTDWVIINGIVTCGDNNN